MLLIPGQLYEATDPLDIGETTSPTSLDLITITPANNVPVYVGLIEVTADVDAAVIQSAYLVKRSATGSGGTSMASKNTSPAGPAAVTTLASLVTTVGAIIGNPIQSWKWQQFDSLVYDRRETGLLVVPGETLSLFIPGTAVLNARVNVLYKEAR